MEEVWTVQLTYSELKAIVAFREGVTHLADMTGDLGNDAPDSCAPLFAAMAPVWEKVNVACAAAGL